MTTKCNVVSWIGFGDQKRTVEKNWGNVCEIWTSVNNTDSILVHYDACTTLCKILIIGEIRYMGYMEMV